MAGCLEGGGHFDDFCPKVQVYNEHVNKYDGVGNEKEGTDSQRIRSRTWLAGCGENIKRKELKTTLKF